MASEETQLTPGGNVADAPSAEARAGEPTRLVVHGDSLEWLRHNAPLSSTSVVTSLPDVSELPHLDIAAWKQWFEGAAVQTLQAVADDAVVVFFQSDIRHAGLWIDKAALVLRAAERAGAGLLFHKIVCRKTPGTVTLARASYSHMLGFSKKLRPAPRPGRTTADVLPDAGFMPGKKSMGVNACLDACRFIKNETQSSTILDPFCGHGTALAVANSLGFHAIGIDLSTRMCRRARALRTSDSTS